MHDHRLPLHPFFLRIARLVIRLGYDLRHYSFNNWGGKVMSKPDTTKWEKIARRLARGSNRVYKLTRFSYMAKDLEEIHRHFDFAKEVSKKGFKP